MLFETRLSTTRHKITLVQANVFKQREEITTSGVEMSVTCRKMTCPKDQNHTPPTISLFLFPANLSYNHNPSLYLKLDLDKSL